MPKSTRVKSHHKSKGGSTKRVACIKKKLKWTPMQMYRVPLSPEQAVLSCCSNLARGYLSYVPVWGGCASTCGKGARSSIAS